MHVAGSLALAAGKRNPASYGVSQPITASTVGASFALTRRAETTVLYGIVQEHLEAFLLHVRESSERRLPRHVEQEFRRYVECGIFAHGFARAACQSCGHELLVPFSCMRRGVCSRCAARRACESAAHLTDHVLPDVPLRRWVLSAPFEMRVRQMSAAEHEPPVSEADNMLMELSTLDWVKPRPYCPQDLVGLWLCIETSLVSSDGCRVGAIWRLHEDGTLETEREEAYDGHRWCAHVSQFGREIWFRGKHSDHKFWVELSGEIMELDDRTGLGVSRWQRLRSPNGSARR